MNLYQKLLEVKKAVPYLKKGTKAYNFDYASPETVLGVLNPLLNDQGIILKTEVIESDSERVTVKTKNNEKEETLYKLKLKMTWVNTDDPIADRDENYWFASGINGDEQGVGSALTYAERYFMLKYFNIPTGKDDPDSFVERQKLRSESTETHPQGKKIQNPTNVSRNFKAELKEVMTRKDLGDYYENLMPKEREEALPYLAARKKELSNAD